MPQIIQKSTHSLRMPMNHEPDPCYFCVSFKTRNQVRCFVGIHRD